MKPKTLAEKYCQLTVAGTFTQEKSHFATSTSWSHTMQMVLWPVKTFKEMGGKKVYDPNKIAVIFDHACPAPYERVSNIHMYMREFASEQGTHFFECGEGVCHQLVIENNLVKPGDLVLGTDSHTCTYGAVGAFSTGVGATDMAAALFTGKNWFKVPETIRINLKGQLQAGCSAKDIILYVIGLLGAAGETTRPLSFTENTWRPVPWRTG